MQKLKCSVPWFRLQEDYRFLKPCIIYLTLEFGHQDVLFLPDLFGEVCLEMFEIIVVPVFLANEGKYYDM